MRAVGRSPERANLSLPYQWKPSRRKQHRTAVQRGQHARGIVRQPGLRVRGSHGFDVARVSSGETSTGVRVLTAGENEPEAEERRAAETARRVMGTLPGVGSPSYAQANIVVSVVEPR